MGEGAEVLMSRDARGLLGEVDIVAKGGLVVVGVMGRWWWMGEIGERVGEVDLEGGCGGM